MSFQYEVNVTHRCNWDCPYCSMRYVKSWGGAPTWELIAAVPRGSTLTLSGGEPGLLQRKELEKILSAAQGLDLHLNTNGTFLKRFPELSGLFSRINLHLDPSRKVFMTELETVNRVVVATKTNQDTLLEFLGGLTSLGKFDVIPSTHSTGKVDEFTCTKLDPRLFPFMSKESLRHYFLGDRYKGIVYLN